MSVQDTGTGHTTLARLFTFCVIIRHQNVYELSQFNKLLHKIIVSILPSAHGWCTGDRTRCKRPSISHNDLQSSMHLYSTNMPAMQNHITHHPSETSFCRRSINLCKIRRLANLVVGFRSGSSSSALSACSYSGPRKTWTLTGTSVSLPPGGIVLVSKQC